MNHKITALTLQKRNRQRVSVYLDGEFAFGLSRIVAAWLEVGQEISDERIERLKAEDGREVAYQQALNLLNYRSRTEKEIRDHLVKKGTSEDVLEDVMERLHRAGLINDARFAEGWVENRNEFRPRSRRALAYELRQRGVLPQAINAALEGVDDEELAYQAAQKQARKYRELDWQVFRTKMIGFLGRRGFNYTVSAAAVARVWAELSDDDRTLENEEVNL